MGAPGPAWTTGTTAPRICWWALSSSSVPTIGYQFEAVLLDSALCPAIWLCSQPRATRAGHPKRIGWRACRGGA
jgi:hypothetical protein